MRQAIRIVERRDGDEVTLQARIYALAPGATRATLHRVAVPPGVRSKSGAQRWAEQVRRDIEAGKPPPQTREGRARAAERKPAAPVERATLRAAVEPYLEDCRGRGAARSSVDAMRVYLLRACEVAGDAPLEVVGEREASAVRASLVAAGYAVRTINATCSVLATMLRRCAALGLRGPLVDRIERVRDRSTRGPKAYDNATFERILSAAAARSPVDAAIVLACGEAGLRLGELVGLQVRDLDAAARTLRVERSVSPRGEVTAPKGGRVRTVALTERTAAALARLATADPGAPLLTGRSGGRIARCTAAYRLKRAQRAAGLPPVGPHGLRHTAASSALAGGADPVAVQKMLGHAQLATTVSTYLHDQGDGPRRAADALERARSSVRETDTDLTRAPQTRQSRVKRRSEKLSQGADLDGEI